MDYRTLILIYIVLFFKDWCKSGTLISFNGCFMESELHDDEKHNSIFIEQNYPGLCLQTCIHQKRTYPVAVALKDTSCLCLNRTNTKEATETSTRNCIERCPGHDEMYCGHKTVNCYSSYQISYSVIYTTEEQWCAAYEKGSPELTMLNCSESHPTFCYELAGRYCEEITPIANWSQELLKCTGIGLKLQYYTTGNLIESELCPDVSDIKPGFYPGTTPTFWIPAFGQNAPIVPCPELMAPLHGNIILAANPRIAEYTCESGFELTPNGTRFCLANRTWNGTTPICKKLVTTTQITETSVETTADATTSTLIRSTSDSTIGLILGIVFGVAVSCIAAASVAILCKVRQDRKRKHKVSQRNNENVPNEKKDVHGNYSSETSGNLNSSGTDEYENNALENDNSKINLTQKTVNVKVEAMVSANTTQTGKDVLGNTSNETLNNTKSIGTVKQGNEAFGNDKSNGYTQGMVNVET